jgi:hypothetical protein
MRIISDPCKRFLIKELHAIKAPPLGLSHSPRHIEQLITVFDYCLAEPTTEARVTGLAHKVSSALAIVVDSTNSQQRLMAPLESLATAFEPFLKKIALIKFAGDHLRLNGDADYVGTLDATLGKLLEGKLGKRQGRPQCPAVLAPLVTFSYNPTTVQEWIYFSTREIRNRVHASQDVTASELTSGISTVLAAYLLAIEENVSAIRQVVDPLFRHIRSFVDGDIARNHVYIDSIGQERPSVALAPEELIAVEWTDYLPRQDSAITESNNHAAPPLSGTLVEIGQRHRRFWLIGEPGSGKSTSLRNLALSFAKELLMSGWIERACPVIVSATIVTEGYSLLDAASDILQMPAAEVVQLLESGHLFLILDALNETSETERVRILRECRQVMQRYPDASFVIASRKHSLDRSLGLAVIELLPFSDTNIHDFILQAVANKATAERLAASLIGPESRFLTLARNPLLLGMICRVAREGRMPTNRAEVIQLFTAWLLQRERHSLSGSAHFYEMILAELAFCTRESRVGSMNIEAALAAVNKICRDAGMAISVYKVIEQLTSAHLLASDHRHGVRFVHELILEYFAARGLRTRLDRRLLQLESLVEEREWHEVIRMYVGLSERPTDVLRELVKLDLSLTAKCITAMGSADNEIERIIVEQARERIAKAKKHRNAAHVAIAALLELGSKNALRVIAQSPIDEQMFEHALWQCERPENASLGLLRFGFTGRRRLQMCIRAFRGHRVSRQFLDSEEIARAQCVLLEPPTLPSFVHAVTGMGLSKGAREAAKSLLNSDLLKSTKDIKIWAACIQLAVTHGLVESTADGLRKVLPPADELDARRGYGVLFALSSLERNSDTCAAALEYAKVCFRKGLIVLGCELVTQYALIGEIDELDIKSHAKRASDAGRLGQMTYLYKVFQHVDLSAEIQHCVEKVLESGNVSLLLSYRHELRLVVGKCAKAFRDAIVRISVAQGITFRALRRLLAPFQLQSQFVELWVVRRILTERPVGFVVNAVTGEEAFLQLSLVENWPTIGERNTPVGRLLEGDIQPSISYPGKLVVARGRFLI